MSSLLGFIVGMALLAGSMATVAWVLTTTPEGGTTETSRELESAGIRSIQSLTTSPGQPADWNKTSDLWNSPPDQIGLLRDGTDQASLDKIRRFQSGDVNTTILLRSQNLQASGLNLDATGQVVPVPAMQAPATTTYGVGEALKTHSDSSGIKVQLSARTLAGMALFETVNTGFEATVHEWNYGGTTHPETGLGNVHPDKAWFVETQLIPQMAGIEATYTLHETGSDADEQAANAIDAYQSGDHQLTRWNVVTDDEPSSLPGNGYTGENVLATAFCKNPGNGCTSGSGWGLWRDNLGMQTFALLGGFDMTGHDNGTLEMKMSLREGDNACQNPNDSECVDVDPAILFWNTTADPSQWSRLDPDESCDASEAWDGRWGNESTGGGWATKTVNLCQAASHASGTMWLTLYWGTECLGGSDSGDCWQDPDEVNKRGWMVDDMAVKNSDGDEVWSTGFEPGDSDEDRRAVFTSSGVDHALHEPVADEAEPGTYAYLHRFVRGGGNVIAYEPGTAGDWLGHVGLQAVDRNTTRHVTTPDPDQLAMRMPHDLPAEDTAYDAADPAWSNSDTPAAPNETRMPDMSPLSVIQRTTETNPVATMLEGQPYTDGGKVTALAYPMASFNDTDLREKIAENLYMSLLFEDPTFDMQGATVPDAGTVPVQALSRVVLAEVTMAGDFQVPLEVTLYIWPEQVG